MPSKHKFFTDAEWEEIICQCKASGLSDWQWCRDNGISTSSFYRHLKKFRNPITVPAADVQAVTVGEVQEVVPLVIRDEEPPVPAVSAQPQAADLPAVRLTVRGISLDIFNHAGSDVISNIIRAVEGLC